MFTVGYSPQRQAPPTHGGARAVKPMPTTWDGGWTTTWPRPHWRHLREESQFTKTRSFQTTHQSRSNTPYDAGPAYRGPGLSWVLSQEDVKKNDDQNGSGTDVHNKLLRGADPQRGALSTRQWGDFSTSRFGCLFDGAHSQQLPSNVIVCRKACPNVTFAAPFHTAASPWANSPQFLQCGLRQMGVLRATAVARLCWQRPFFATA